MRPLSLLLLTALLLAGPTAGQTGAIQGRVRAASGVPLPGVNVSVGATAFGAATDADGRYRIAGLPAGEHRLIVSAVGFRPDTLLVIVEPNRVVTRDIVLAEVVVQSGEVVVTASRRAQLSHTVPASLVVLSPRELTVRNTVSLDEALRYVPGVQMQGNQVTIRGTSGFAFNTGSRVLLLVDGVPLLTPDTEGVPFDALPFSQIAQVEVLKGPGSALYGSGALGGVVHVRTRDYPDAPETTVGFFGGAYEPVRYRIWRAAWDEADTPRPLGGITIAHARRLGETAGMWVDLAYRADSGYLHRGTQRLFRGFSRTSWQPGPGMRLDVLGGFLARRKDNFLFWNGGRDALNPGTLAFGSSDGPTGSSDNQVTQFSLLPTLTHVVGRRLFYTVRTRLFAVLIRPVDNATGKVKPLSEGTAGLRYGGEAQLDWNPRPGHHLTLGMTGDANATRSSFFVTRDGDETGGQPQGALYAQWEQPLTPRLHVVAGLRFDGYRIDIRETVTKLSPKLSAAYALHPRLALRAAFGQGFRVPSLAERFTDNQDFFPIVRNLGLLPEESTSIEIGMRGLFPLTPGTGAGLDLALFSNTFDNLIEPRFVPTAQAFQFVNLPDARIRGLEATLDLSLSGGRTHLRAGYTLLDAEDRATGEPLSFRPRHLFLGSLDAAVFGPFEAGFDIRYAARPERLDTDFARFVPDADLLVDTRVLDLRAAAQWSRVRIAFLVKNALEYYYLERPAYLAPPRHFLLQVQATL